MSPAFTFQPTHKKQKCNPTHLSIHPKLSRTPASKLYAMDLSSSMSLMEHPNLLLSAISSDVEPIQSFEPVVNVPALSSFLLIFVVFSFLQLRIHAIGQAVNRRTDALQQLRNAKSKQLSYAMDANTPEKAMEMERSVNNAMEEYRRSLEEEYNTRTIIPGVRIAAPNRPDSNDENVAAAKLFLDMDLIAQYDGEESKLKEPSSSFLVDNTVGQSNSRNAMMEGDESDTDFKKGFSGSAIATMALIVTTQIALLYMLSFDPMQASTFASY